MAVLFRELASCLLDQQKVNLEKLAIWRHIKLRADVHCLNDFTCLVILPKGCSCSAAVKHTLSYYEVLGSNPAGCQAFFLFFYIFFFPSLAECP